MKRDTDDIMAGLDRLSAMLTVFGTYASWHECETEDAKVSPIIMTEAYDMMSDYAQMLREQLQDIQYPESNIHVLKDAKQIG